MQRFEERHASRSLATPGLGYMTGNGRYFGTGTICAISGYSPHSILSLNNNVAMIGAKMPLASLKKLADIALTSLDGVFLKWFYKQ